MDVRALWLSLATAAAFGAAALASVPAVPPAEAAPRATAVFAGGCFWCTEADFEKIPGVIEAVSGFSGGSVVAPSYEQVVRGGTGHLEAVEVTYDPDAVSYADLLDYYWRTIDPTDNGGQFCDRGESYRAAIFVADDAARAEAEASRARVLATGRFRTLATEIRDFDVFYPADAYHQDYYKSQERIITRFGVINRVTKAEAYVRYREGCGRDARLGEVWGEEAGVFRTSAPAADPAAAPAVDLDADALAGGETRESPEAPQ